MKAVLLVGGRGSRLANYLPQNTPKPMAEINGKPFLEYLIKYLVGQKFSEIILSVGFLKEQIINYFGNNFNGVKISYAEESEMLGTGGAIKNAFKNFNSEKFIVLNGDSFQEINFEKFIKKSQKSNISLVIREVENSARYGSLEFNENKITNFIEKGKQGRGYINSGCYYIAREWFLGLDLPEKFSFEADFLMKFCNKIEINYYSEKGYFVDIGVIEDYQKAKIDIPKLINL